jgi:hypothetical protein
LRIVLVRCGFRQRTVFTGGQSALLGGRACPEVAFLRELKGNLRLVLVRARAWCVLRFSGVCWRFGGKRFSRENVPEMTELLEGIL